MPTLPKTIQDKIEPTGYSFVEKGHCHYINGKRATGITTVLQIIAKPALIGWSANMAIDYAKEKGQKKDEDFYLISNQDLEDARKAHTIKKEAAGDIGKSVHLAAEEFLKNKTEPTLDAKGMEMFENFRKWLTDNKVRVIESEKHLYSESMFLGGILDLVVEIDGQFWIADIKTGSGIYPEHFYQMAAYQILWEDMKLPEKITGHIVLNLKKDGTFEEKRSISNEEAKEAFMSAFKLYKINQKFNSMLK